LFRTVGLSCLCLSALLEPGSASPVTVVVVGVMVEYRIEIGLAFVPQSIGVYIQNTESLYCKRLSKQLQKKQNRDTRYCRGGDTRHCFQCVCYSSGLSDRNTLPDFHCKTSSISFDWIYHTSFIVRYVYWSCIPETGTNIVLQAISRRSYYVVSLPGSPSLRNSFLCVV
jgi:hypothetical protein